MSEIICHNGNFIASDSLLLGISNRAFRYGDSVFETLRYSDGKIFFLENHFDRLQEGMRLLKMNTPNNFTKERFEPIFKNLIQENKIQGDARIRLQVFRKDGGWYTPSTNDVDYVIEIKLAEFRKKIKEKVGIYTDVTLSYSSISHFKTGSCLPYILASISCKENKMDDMILLDGKGHIAECLYSNIFWIKEKTFYTPSVITGCLNGIFRRNFINNLKKKEIEIKEVNLGVDILHEAEVVFTTNVVDGVCFCKNINEKEYKTYDKIVTEISNESGYFN